MVLNKAEIHLRKWSLEGGGGGGGVSRISMYETLLE